MPLFARKPALALGTTGEVIVLVSEPAQRNRGSMEFLEPATGDLRFTCSELPGRRERLGWSLVSTSQQVPTEPTLTPIFVRQLKGRKDGDPQPLRYLRHAQGMEITHFPTFKEFHVFFWWNLFSPVKQTPPQSNIDYQINNFLSTYKLIPISWTLHLEEREPHSVRIREPDPSFRAAVGDPPLDPGGAWPGIYNGFDRQRVLLVGGSAWSKSYDPFQLSDSYLNLPVDPGLITAAAVRRQASLVNLGSIEGSLWDHTQHLYHQREIQATRAATRCLMCARGYLHDLIAYEKPPIFDETAVSGGDLSIGSSELIPATVNESYVGTNTVSFEDTTILFPFGAALPGFITLIPGEIGHQFEVKGGQEPYSWCLRKTRSSQSDPARLPFVPGVDPSPDPYPFDDQGNLLTLDPVFPDAVTGGGLPPGMLLNRDGLFYGTPTRVGTFLFRLHVRDRNGLRGETTIRFIVLSSSTDKIPCSSGRGFPVNYKTTITQISLPILFKSSDLSNWEGRVEVVGGQSGKYNFFFPRSDDSPYQQTPRISSRSVLTLSSGDGRLSLGNLQPEDFDQVRGVWVFEIQAIEIMEHNNSGPMTCDRRAVSLSIGTTRTAGISDTDLNLEDGILPEGRYTERPVRRSYLILDPPVIVDVFIQGKNVYLRGNRGFPLRPDLGGLNLNPGIVTSLNPGVVNPVQVIGINPDSLSPAHIYQDWTHSDPCDYFRDTYDRFDPVPVAPSSGGDGAVTGTQIDDQLPIGKRIRPLWPV